MTQILNAFLLFTLLFATANATPFVRITNWKNNAEGAYSFIMDDYCASNAMGIGYGADSLFRSHHLKMGFAIIVGACLPVDWQIAKSMVNYGHEAINHSWSHACGQNVKWCTDGFGFGKIKFWNEKDFAKEIDRSTEYIERKAGKRPRFFAFPFDLSTNRMIEYLDSLGYFGARAQSKAGQINPPDFDPFHFSFDVRQPPQNKQYQKFGLQEMVRQSIHQKGWGIRVVHGMEDRSYASLPRDTLKLHLDMLQKLSKSGTLWVATPSEVILYRKTARAFVPQMTEQPNSSIQVKWKRSNQPLPSEIVPITLEFSGLKQPIQHIVQNGKELSFSISPNKNTVLCNIKPGEEALLISFAD